MPLPALRSTYIVRISCAAMAMVCATAMYAQAIITTAAGGGFVNNAPALQSHLGGPQGAAVDAAGNVYIADSGRILRLDHATAILSAVAGAPTTVYTTSDGPALSVRIMPSGVAIDSSGNVLFLDGSRLRRLNLQQAAISTIAGGATSGSAGDNGPAADALLNSPQQFCLDSAGNIYIVELAGYVRRIDANTSVITTIAGNGGARFGGDGGAAKSATLVQPRGIAVDSAGNLYIADSGDFRIRRIAAATQIITTVAGNGQTTAGGDGGSALQASFAALGALAIDSQNNLSVIDASRVRRIAAATGVITTLAGTGTAGLTGDGGAAAQAEINLPAGLAFDSSANLYLADTGNQRLRLISASSGVITTIAGTSQSGDGGLAAGATLTHPTSLAIDAAGDLYIGGGNTIRRVSQSTGIISTFAGGGSSTQDGIPATQAQLNPLSLAVDSAGNLYVGQPGTIRRIDASGTIRTVAGTGVSGFSGDGGPATSAKITNAGGLAFDTSGNLLFADSGNRRVRRVNIATGTIATIAGNGQATVSAVGVQATQAAVGNVTGVATDSTGNIYIGTFDAHYLLKVSADGILSIAGGNSGCSYIGDGGQATLASLCKPASLTTDAGGNIFVADMSCYCVRRIAGDTGIIQTVAGTGIAGYTGDNGPATQARLQSIGAVAAFGATLYIADPQSGVVRGVTPDTPPALPGTPAFSAITSSASFLTGAIAPGELISFFGHYLGGATPAFATLGADGKVTHELSNVQVLFDGVPSPLIYVAAGQINAIAPYSVANGVHSVTVQTPGGSVSNTNVSVIGSSPAVFPYAIVNQDGTLNNSSHPAPVGSYVVMYGTGLGQTKPVAVDGAINPLSDFPKQVYSVGIGISRNPLFAAPLPVTVFYAGPAPGLVSGVCQINILIPTGTLPGENFLQIAAGPGTSPSISIFVQ